MVPRELSVVRIRRPDALREGDKTVHDLLPFTFISLENTRAYLRMLRRSKSIHVTGWHRSVVCGPPTAIYRIGLGEDAPKPPPLTPAERKRRLYESPAYVEKLNNRRRAVSLGKKVLSSRMSFIDLL